MIVPGQEGRRVSEYSNPYVYPFPVELPPLIHTSSLNPFSQQDQPRTGYHFSSPGYLHSQVHVDARER